MNNNEELEAVGLRVRNEGGTAYLNALLFALHNFVFKEHSVEWWEQVPSLPLRTVISSAQEFVDYEKGQQELS